MIKFKNIFFISVAVFVLLIFGFGGASCALADWTSPISSPPACDPVVDGEGCNPPINTGVTPQIKSSSFTAGFLSTIDSFIDDNGQIAELIDSAVNTIVSFQNYLNIFGGGMPGMDGGRNVKIWDNLYIPGSINAYTYNICTAGGSCSPLTVTGGGYWMKSGASLYPTTLTDNVGIGTVSPYDMLTVSSPSSGAIIRLDNSAATPIQSWRLLSNNPNGLFAIRDETKATHRLVIDTQGQVGIGTNAPNANLHIGANATGRSMIKAEATTENAYLMLARTAGSNPNTAIIVNKNDGTLRINNVNDSGQANLVISPVGDVGIGIAAPLTKLDVQGVGTFSNGVILGGNSLVGSNKTIEFGGGVEKSPQAGSIAYKAWSDGLDIVGAGTDFANRLVKIWDNLIVPGNITATNLCTIDGSCSSITDIISGGGLWTKSENNIYNANTNGNVGIGTNAPGAPLEVFKSGGNPDTTGGGLILSRYNTGGGNYRGGAIYSRYISGTGVDTDALVFGVTTANAKNPYSDFDQARMVILANGNVGIGTTNPRALLNISGAGPGNPSTLKIGNTLGKIWQLGEVIANNNFEIYDTAVGSRFTIQGSTGNVGIGTIAPVTKLDVLGVGAFSNGVILNGTSFVPGANFLKFGDGLIGQDAGKIGWHLPGSLDDALDIVGDGLRFNRLVRIWDRLIVRSSITVPVLYANNICNTANPPVCVSIADIATHIGTVPLSCTVSDTYTTALCPTACGTPTSGHTNTHTDANCVTTTNTVNCPAVAACAVNGGWSAWSACSGLCEGTGIQTRTCTNPSPANGGTDCSALDGGNSSQPCTNNTCQIPSFSINDVDSESSNVGIPNHYVLPNKDAGYRINVQNGIGGCYFKRNGTNYTGPSSLITFPRVDDINYPATPYFPKLRGVNEDTISLECSGYAEKTMYVGVKPTIVTSPESDKFAVTRGGLINAGELIYQWKTTSGASGDHSNTLECKIDPITMTYYQRGVLLPAWGTPSAGPSTIALNNVVNDGWKNAGSLCEGDKYELPRQRCVVDAYITCWVKPSTLSGNLNYLVSAPERAFFDQTY